MGSDAEERPRRTAASAPTRVCLTRHDLSAGSAGSEARPGSSRLPWALRACAASPSSPCPFASGATSASSSSSPRAPSPSSTPRSTSSTAPCASATSAARTAPSSTACPPGDAPSARGGRPPLRRLRVPAGTGHIRDGRAGARRPRLPAGEEVTATMAIALPELPHHFRPGTKELRQMIRKGAVTIALQPIVDMQTRGRRRLRGARPGAPPGPSRVPVRAVPHRGDASASRRSCRACSASKAVELLAHRTDLPTLFLNTHSCELAQPGSRRVARRAASGGAPARPGPGDPRERPRPPGGAQRRCARSSPR